jgi:hypothetical protein
VNGFLENVGSVKACGVKVGVAGAEQTYSVWPEWVQKNKWEVDFQPKQVG